MRKFIINVNGNSYEVDVEEVSSGTKAPRETAPIARPAAQSAKPAPVQAPKTEKKEVAVAAGQEIVDSPMPGNIWKILVTEGQEVKEGEVLLILEAMKMENEIVSPRDGKVASIVTTAGAAVNTGDKLVIID